jgi:hypothetical protein
MSNVETMENGEMPNRKYSWACLGSSARCGVAGLLDDVRESPAEAGSGEKERGFYLHRLKPVARGNAAG